MQVSAPGYDLSSHLFSHYVLTRHFTDASGPGHLSKVPGHSWGRLDTFLPSQLFQHSNTLGESANILVGLGDFADQTGMRRHQPSTTLSRNKAPLSWQRHSGDATSFCTPTL